ncbi:MAG: hypothetical protein KIT14_06420 [bacterium]|nr:hypothetical protein [bacterium]
MGRRYAILEDNDRAIAGRLEALRTCLPALIADRVCAVMVIGSVSEGRARDHSDLDLLLVLRAGLPRRSDYTWWDVVVAPHLPVPAAGPSGFPIAPVFVGRGAKSSAEPNLRRALEIGIPLWDPEGFFHDESRPRA